MALLGTDAGVAYALDSFHRAGSAAGTLPDQGTAGQAHTSAARQPAVCVMGADHPAVLQLLQPPGILRDAWSTRSGIAAGRMAGTRNHFSVRSPRAPQRARFITGVDGDWRGRLRCGNSAGSAIADTSSQLRHRRAAQEKS